MGYRFSNLLTDTNGKKKQNKTIKESTILTSGRRSIRAPRNNFEERWKLFRIAGFYILVGVCFRLRSFLDLCLWIASHLVNTFKELLCHRTTRKRNRVLTRFGSFKELGTVQTCSVMRPCSVGSTVMACCGHLLSASCCRLWGQLTRIIIGVRAPT